MVCSDPSTLSNYQIFPLEKVDFAISLCFDSKVLMSQSWFTFLTTDKTSTELVLDTDYLVVEEVLGQSNESKSSVKLNFSLSPRTSFRGQSLSVDVAPLSLSDGERFKLGIKSKTTKDCRALQWMEPNETSGKKHPYMYSQCQSINCRTLVPCQDSPGQKFTYTAQVTVPTGLSVVMSAIRNDSATSQSADKSLTTFHFKQDQPIPSYLLAIAAGNIVKADLGNRCAVYTEPEEVEKCKYEFAEVEKILKIAEDLCGPYLWSRYDFLVLPPTFPYGGMENPNMTFLSPTIVAGDRSMVNVLAHEITHSWTGNLVTTVSWEHFWLNEGWTRFIEGKIQALMEKDVTDLQKFISDTALKHMDDDVQVFRDQGKFELTRLVTDLSDTDPEDAFSSVPYEKGCNLLSYVEQLVGGAAVFEPYMRSYIQRFKRDPIDSQTWWTDLIASFPEKKQDLIELPWQDIFHKPGKLTVAFDTSNELSRKCSGIVKRWLEVETSEGFDAICSEYSNASTFPMMVKLEILEGIREKNVKWSSEKFWRFTDFLAIRGTRNCELLTPWLRIGLSSELREVIQPAIDLVKTVGRMKFNRPVQRALYAWEESRPLALETFELMRPFMNPICAKRVMADLHLV